MYISSWDILQYLSHCQIKTLIFNLNTSTFLSGLDLNDNETGILFYQIFSSKLHQEALNHIQVYPHRIIYTLMSTLNYDVPKIKFLYSLFIWKKMIVFVTNANFLIPLSWQPNVVDLRYFILRIQLDEIV